jgi:NADPH:quinone reductase-like Zn-dependent oxidoreductase
MKAAVLYDPGDMPRYADCPEPMPKADDEILVSVKAVALKHFDKSRASGKHYSTEKINREAKVIGGDGVCVLPDGRRVYAIGAGGMMAERAIIEKDRMVPLPEALDDLTAAALPNAVFGSAMALRFRAAMEPGETVLINGATGFTGRLAVQIAKQYGAGKIIATGRNPSSLKDLLTLGSDEVIPIGDNEGFAEQLQKIHRQTPVNVIIDYLWGSSAETILNVIKGDGSFTPRTRFVSVGAMTGDKIQISAALLRGTDLQLSGSGLGSWNKRQIGSLFSEILPDMFQLAAGGKLTVHTIPVALPDIENLWEVDVTDGKRLVVQI